MSKLIKEIREQWAGKKRIEIEPLRAFVDNTPGEDINYKYQQNYRIGISWWREIWCRPEEIYRMKAVCCDELREDIYGEFRRDLFALIRVSYDGDRKKIIECAEKLLAQIRDDG